MGSFFSSVSTSSDSKSLFNNPINNIVFQPPTPNKIFKNTLNNIKSKNGNNIYYRSFLKKSDVFMIWSHGNAMLCYHLDVYLKQLSDYLNVNIICYDYQGYGFSDGTCCEQNCYDDLKSIIDYVKNEGDSSKKIILVGHSLGTGVVIDFVSKNNWRYPVMIISPYKSMARIVTDEYSYSSSYIASPIDIFDSYSKMSNVKCPVKIVHGVVDSLIDVRHGKELYEKLSNKTLKPIWIEDADHNNILEKMSMEAYIDLLKK